MARFLKKLLSNKTDEDGDSFTSAHLGEENNFYYNEELKQWVIRGEEDKVRESMTNAPPPPPEPTNLPTQNFLDLSTSASTNTFNNNNNVTNTFSPTTNQGGRRLVRSSQLYTNIPGMNVIETKPTNQSFLNFPTTTSSQFIPSKDDFDANLVNDAYADLMKSNAPATLEAPEEPEDQNKQ